MSNVLDASVLAKIVLEEEDSALAKQLIRQSISSGDIFYVPPLFEVEFYRAIQRPNVDLSLALDTFEGMNHSLFEVLSPTRAMWLRAEEITKTGHPKSGYPSLYDSVYHAMALELGSTFITADRKHYAKAAQHGGISMLADFL